MILKPNQAIDASKLTFHQFVKCCEDTTADGAEDMGCVAPHNADGPVWLWRNVIGALLMTRTNLYNDTEIVEWPMMRDEAIRFVRRQLRDGKTWGEFSAPSGWWWYTCNSIVDLVQSESLDSVRLDDGEVQPRRVYISGPMTGLPDYNHAAFCAAAEALRDEGHVVVNPAMLPNGLTQFAYMDIALAMLRACDTIKLLSGYQDSPGALAELALAKKLKMEVM
jgi:hypothetical protein